MLRWGNAHEFDSHHNTLLSLPYLSPFNAENSHSDAKGKQGRANDFQRNMYFKKGEICHNGSEIA